MPSPRFTILTISILSSLVLSGCLETKIDEERMRVQEEKIENEKQQIIENQLTDSEKELIQSQKEVTPSEAVESANKELNAYEDEQVDKAPKIREKYSDVTEFSQYISYVFYQFHKGELTPEEFYERISPFYHEHFSSMLPSDRENQIEMYGTLQEMFTAQIRTWLDDYQVTKPVRTTDTEYSFYRKYELKEGEPIYYLTIAVKENGYWYLYDDQPSAAHEVIEETTETEETE